MTIPANIIIAWSGLINEIPNGWVLCDGNNGTPNLQNRFIGGSGDLYNVGDTGGFADATLVQHNHTATVSTAPNHTHSAAVFDPFTGTGEGQIGNNINPRTNNITTSTSGAHTHTVNFEEVGEDPTNKNLPPYYALAFIMKEAN
jgi:microcystin-dependent protein